VHQASSAGTTKLRYDPDFRRYFAVRNRGHDHRPSGSGLPHQWLRRADRYRGGSGAVPYLLLVAFGVPAVAVFFDGANFGALPVLVGTDRIAEANFIVWSFATGVEIVLPSVVGLSLAVTHPATLLGFDALSFIASVALLRMIARPLQDPARPLQRGLGSVLADIRGPAFPDRPCRGTDDDHRGRHPVHGGWRLRRVDGGVVRPGSRHRDAGLALRPDLVVLERGRLAATLLLPRLLRRTSPARITLAALPVSAVLGVLTALAPNWQWAALGLLSWSGAYMLVVVNSISYRQQVTPEPLLGRVNTAGRMLAWGAGWTGGAALAGLVASAVGVRHAMVLMTTVNLVGVVVAWTSPLRTATASDLPTSESS